MPPKPIYTATQLNPAYHLRYTWTGWPSEGSLPSLPSEAFFAELSPAWEGDGIRLLEHVWAEQQVQITTSVTPQVSAVLFTARAKGRLQHALREGGRPTKLSRKVAMRGIGDNRTADVEAYIRRQVEKEPLADPRFRELLTDFSVIDESVDLSQPTPTASGRYWYNLHLVLTTQERYRVADRGRLTTIRDYAFGIAARKGHVISALAAMPDHVHVAMRGNVEHSPEEIALAFMNNLAFVLGQNAIWEHGYYVGTFSEYDMQAVRRRYGCSD